MIRYLLDTDTCSYFLKTGKASLRRRVRAGMMGGSLAISVITRAELRYGLEFLPSDHFLRVLVNSFLQQIQVLAWTEAAADEYARLAAGMKRTGKPIGILDTQIAAQALAENLVLVTNNTRHFGAVHGLKIENWTV